MYTQCPNCQTLFRIGVEQLKAADGKAHCCRCDKVFNALGNLRSRSAAPEGAWPESQFIDNLPQQQDLPFHTLLQENNEATSQVDDLGTNITSSLIDTFEVEDSLPISSELTNTNLDHNLDPFEPDVDLSDLDMDSQQLNIEDSLSETHFSSDSHINRLSDANQTLPDSDLKAFETPFDPNDLKIDSDQFHFEEKDSLFVENPNAIPEFSLTNESNNKLKSESNFSTRLSMELEADPEEEESNLEQLFDTDIDSPLAEDEFSTEATNTHSLFDSEKTLPPSAFNNAPPLKQWQSSAQESASDPYKPSAPTYPSQEEETGTPPKSENGAEIGPISNETGDHHLTEDELADEIEPENAHLDKSSHPFDHLTDLPDIPAHANEPLSVDELLAGSTLTRRKSRLWTTLTLVLICVALVQSVWFGRVQLTKTAIGKPVVKLLCQNIECDLPPEVAPDQFVIISRSITSHPDSDNALLVRLSATNRATFSQKPPQLQLSLFDRNEVLIARRTFTPKEYHKPSQTLPDQIAPGELLEIEIALVDPGEKATGFKFEFY